MLDLRQSAHKNTLARRASEGLFVILVYLLRSAKPKPGWLDSTDPAKDLLDHLARS